MFLNFYTLAPFSLSSDKTLHSCTNRYKSKKSATKIVEKYGRIDFYATQKVLDKFGGKRVLSLDIVQTRRKKRRYESSRTSPSARGITFLDAVSASKPHFSDRIESFSPRYLAVFDEAGTTSPSFLYTRRYMHETVKVAQLLPGARYINSPASQRLLRDI